MNRGRDSTIRNHHIEFEYDSADLPFSPPTRSAGYLESGLPFWKLNISDPDKSISPARTSSDQPVSPLFKFGTSSRSSENVTLETSSSRPKPLPLITQSLPASPLSTPGPTPLSTPVPTPHSSPALIRKEVEMEAACKSAIRFNQEQLAPKWTAYFGLRTGQSPSDNRPAEDFSRISDSHPRFDNITKAEFRPLTYLQKRALAISNRDMNFLAPTSM